ncbi:MAG TPA: RNA polymerase sigma-70 factor [Lentimicrobium sp.]|jgi:RNA polymerase sigma-70 factor (ECF subfamily)|nr:RNA polymerase sigma-70 factor [Lentimicrobium sp.]
MAKETEKLTVLALKNGDKQVFESVFREFYGPLCTHARRFLVDAGDAEEVVQEVFFKMWERRDMLVISTSLSAYLYKAVTNHALNFIRYQKMARQYQEYIGFNTSEDDQISAHDTLLHNDLETKFGAIVKTMPERRRIIFEMSRIEGLKYHEIATKLNISAKTVEIQMSKALEFMRDKLRDYLPAWAMLIMVISQF